MLLQPQTLAQHFVHGIADRILVTAHDRLDLHSRSTQTLFECIGGVQNLGHRALATSATLSEVECDASEDRGGEQQQEDNGQAVDPGGQKPQSAATPGAGQIPRC